MNTAGLWMHAWDVWSDGLETVLGFAGDSGLNCVYPASAYHAGWFIHPHSTGRRVWQTEDGVVYFHPDQAIWRDSRIRPRVASICAEVDWFARLRDTVGDYGLSMSAWTVCCHNTPLGHKHPDIVVENCFGDRYPHALNPSHPDVRSYLAALVRNLAVVYRVRSVQLEAPHYLGFRHGHHHERHSVRLDAVAQRLFDLSFAASDLALARAAAIDGERLRRRVAELLQDYLDRAPEPPAEWPRSWSEAVEQVPDLRQYVNAQAAMVEGLKDRCRSALEGTETRLEGLGCGSQYDLVTLCLYGQSPEQVARHTAAARAALEPGQELQIGLRVGFGEVGSAGELADLVAAGDDSGADGVLFYNYSEMSRANLSWLGPAVAGRVRR